MKQNEELLPRSFQWIMRDPSGRPIAELPAYHLGIRGLVVHRSVTDPVTWTISHWSGLHIGGIFTSLEQAFDLASDFFRNTKVNWTLGPADLRSVVQAEIESRGFKLRFSSRNS